MAFLAFCNRRALGMPEKLTWCGWNVFRTSQVVFILIFLFIPFSLLMYNMHVYLYFGLPLVP